MAVGGYDAALIQVAGSTRQGGKERRIFAGANLF